MEENNVKPENFSINKTFWPLYFLGGFQSLSYGSLIVLMVPLSYLFWPNDPYHALEMGVLLMVLFWLSSIGGVFFGWLIDKYSRIKILFIISLMRGLSIFMLGLANEGQGFSTYLFFLIFIIVFALFAGGSWPAIISASNDMVPKTHRSRFFGVFGIAMGIFSTIGFLFASIFVQYGYWRLFFWINGIAIILSGFLVIMKIKEPKRGSQQPELFQILQDDSVEYDFDMDMALIKKTMFSKTNLIALIEGVFTNILLGSVHALVLPYLQTPPHNLSLVFTGVFLIVFGITGGLIGQIFLAKFSDQISKDHPIRRIYFIILSLSIGMTTFTLVFFIDLPHLSIAEGQDILFLFSTPVVWVIGILYFISQTISSLYLVNQAPVLQDINLPEAQGKVTSANQFLENIGQGIGPLMVGLLLTSTAKNYQVSVLIILVFIIPGVVLWVLSFKWYPKDREEIKQLMEERARILECRNTE